MKIAIVTCCSTDWLAYALATHYSANRNHTLKLDHFAVTDDADCSKVNDLLARFSSQHGFAVHHLPLGDDELSQHKSGLYPVSALYRLKLAKLLPAGYDRVLHLDSDVLVLRSIDDLLLSDFQGFAISAVEDVWMNIAPSATSVKARLAVGFKAGEDYFNSGVMLMDWKKVQAEKIFESALAKLLETNFRYADQDALNMELAGRWRKLPLDFNVLSVVDDFMPTRAVIRHFTDSRKPWNLEFRAKDIAHRQFYSDFLSSLDGRPALPALPPLGMRIGASLKNYKRRVTRLFKGKPDFTELYRKQVREFVGQRTSRYWLNQ